MKECSYCDEMAENVIPMRIGQVCDRCAKELIEIHGDLDIAIYANSYFHVFLNRDHINIGIAFSLTGWWEIRLGFLTILSNHRD